MRVEPPVCPNRDHFSTKAAIVLPSWHRARAAGLLRGDEVWPGIGLLSARLNGQRLPEHPLVRFRPPALLQRGNRAVLELAGQGTGLHFRPNRAGLDNHWLWPNTSGAGPGWSCPRLNNIARTTPAGAPLPSPDKHGLGSARPLCSSGGTGLRAVLELTVEAGPLGRLRWRGFR